MMIVTMMKILVMVGGSDNAYESHIDNDIGHGDDNASLWCTVAAKKQVPRSSIGMVLVLLRLWKFYKWCDVETSAL